MFAEFDFDSFLLGIAVAYLLAMAFLPRSMLTPPKSRSAYLWFGVLIGLLLLSAAYSLADQQMVRVLGRLVLATGLLVSLLRTKRWFPY